MKTTNVIKVKSPCSQKFSTFKPTADGGFCALCEKEVIDFTKMSDQEILEFFHSNKTKTCGRFKKTQLMSFQQYPALKKQLSLLSFSLFGLMAFANNPVVAIPPEITAVNSPIEIRMDQPVTITLQINEYTVKGVVLDSDGNPIPGVNIVLKGSTTGTNTDFDGKFEFPIKLKEKDVLTFSYIGYQSQQFKVGKSNKETQDITITFEDSDIFLMGDVAVDGVYSSKKNIFQKIAGWFKK